MTATESEAPASSAGVVDPDCSVLRMGAGVRWPLAGELFGMVHAATGRPGRTVRVQMDGLRLRPHGSAPPHWLALLVSLARVARSRGCELVFVAPAHELVPALTRLGLGFEPAAGTTPPTPQAATNPDPRSAT